MRRAATKQAATVLSFSRSAKAPISQPVVRIPPEDRVPFDVLFSEVVEDLRGEESCELGVGVGVAGAVFFVVVLEGHHYL